jgi:DNA-binding XRE family transcriptional regulator
VRDELQNGECLTQRKIAERVGCHKKFVSQIKRQKVIEEQQVCQQRCFHYHVSKVQQFNTSSSALPVDQIIAYSSNLSSDLPVRDMTLEPTWRS